MNGFLGTRASLLVDIALLVFVAMPVLLAVVIRWARRGQHSWHLRGQLVAFGVMTLAVALLEIDVRIQGGSNAIAGRAIGLPSEAVRALLLTHIGVAFVTWVAWLSLLVRSWRQKRGNKPIVLGPFSRVHRQWGRWTYAGVVFTSASGTVLYVLAFR